MKKRWIALLLVCALALTGLAVGLHRNRQKQPVLTCGSFSMDNTEFAYFYWSEFFYFAEVFGDYLADQVDFAVPLDQQAYSDTRTWQDYLLEDALATVRDTMTMALAAQEAGFALTGDYDTQYQKAQVDFASAAAKAGYEDLEAYLQDSYGPGAREESFALYLYHTHLAAAYADQLLAEIVISDEQVMAEYMAHQQDYEQVYGFDPETPELWMDTIRQELQTAEYQNAFRALQSRYDFRVNRDAIRIRPPKGLYDKP